MTEQDKPANDLGAKASAAAGHLKDQAGEFAANAAPKVEAAAKKAGEAASQAATAASHQVVPLAGRLKKLTGGRFDKHIDTASGKLEKALDRDKPAT